MPRPAEMFLSSVFAVMFGEDLTPTPVPLFETNDEICKMLQLLTTKDQGLASIKFNNLQEGLRLGDIVDKFDIWRVDEVLAKLINPLVNEDPLRAFIWSCKHRNLSVARAALLCFKDELVHEGRKVSTLPWLMERSIAVQFEVTTFFSYNKVCFANLVEVETHVQYRGVIKRYETPLSIGSWQKVSEQFTFA